jgi:hypothetical protein
MVGDVRPLLALSGLWELDNYQKINRKNHFG